jgi:hypothetical protein
VSDASATAAVVDDVLFAASADGLLTGRGGGANEVRAYGSIGDALDEWIGRRPDLLDEIPARCRVELEAVTSGGSPSGTQRLFVAVQELLAAAGRAGGAVIAIETHLIDRSTLDLIDHMADGTAGGGSAAGDPPSGVRCPPASSGSRSTAAAGSPRAPGIAAGPRTGGTGEPFPVGLRRRCADPMPPIASWRWRSPRIC